jgi:PemK-like, MazF-like toxin of type II toxin-antitoxin system
MKNDEIKTGEIYIAFVRYVEDKLKDNPRGKVRPVVIFEDEEENKIFACKVSSQVNKPLKQKLGYEVKDWKEAGFTKPSIIACDKENIREIEPKNIKKRIGCLTDRDIKGMFIKRIKVANMEYKRELEKHNELER